MFVKIDRNSKVTLVHISFIFFVRGFDLVLALDSINYQTVHISLVTLLSVFIESC